MTQTQYIEQLRSVYEEARIHQGSVRMDNILDALLMLPPKEREEAFVEWCRKPVTHPLLELFRAQQPNNR